MAKFMKTQSLDLLGKLQDLERTGNLGVFAQHLDLHAQRCEQLHEMAEALLNGLATDLPPDNAGGE